MAEYLIAQAAAGAQALMLFESWAGLLGAAASSAASRSPPCAAPPRALRRTGVPLIYYVNQGAALMQAVADLDVDVIGVDWRTDLAQVRQILGARQGRAGEPRSGGAVRPAARSSSATSMRCSRRPARRRGTSSTSATASGRTRPGCGGPSDRLRP